MLTPNNQQHVFYRDVNHNLEHVFYDPSSGMHAESWGSGIAGDPATMLPGGTNNQQHVFYRDINNGITHVYYDPGSGMHRDLWATGTGSTTFGPAAGGDPATMATVDNQQHIFYRDSNGNVQHVFFDPKSGMHVELWAGTDTSSGEAYLPPVQYGPDFPISQSGTRSWDYNIEGVVHYGMLPDFLHAVRGAPTGADIVDNNMMYGAEYFYQMWKLAEAQSKQVQ
jgi:hypothetical protein